MFSAHIVWRGLIYTILMFIGKLLCGLWLVHLPRRSTSDTCHGELSVLARVKTFFTTRLGKLAAVVSSRGKTPKTRHALDTADSAPSVVADPVLHTSEENDAPARNDDAAMVSLPAAATATTPPSTSKQTTPTKPVSLYPAGIISLAMVARGEIGFLISAVAESKGIFSPLTNSSGSALESTSSDEPSDIFLIVTWAIVLCTIIGPLGVGVLVKRVKKLEAQRRGRDGNGEVSGGGGADIRRGGDEERHEDHVLGSWAV